MIAEFKIPRVVLTPLTPEDLPYHAQKQFKKVLKRKRETSEQQLDTVVPLAKRRSVKCLPIKNTSNQDPEMGGISPPLSPADIRDIQVVIDESVSNFGDMACIGNVTSPTKTHKEVPHICDLTVVNEDINSSVSMLNTPSVLADIHANTSSVQADAVAKPYINIPDSNGTFFNGLPRITSVTSLNKDFQAKNEFKKAISNLRKPPYRELTVDCAKANAPIEVIDVDALPSPSSDSSGEMQVVLEDVSKSPGPHLKQLRRLSECNSKSPLYDFTMPPQVPQRRVSSTQLTPQGIDKNQNHLKSRQQMTITQKEASAKSPSKPCELKVMLDDIFVPNSPTIPQSPQSSVTNTRKTSQDVKPNIPAILRQHLVERKSVQKDNRNIGGAQKATGSKGIPTPMITSTAYATYAPVVCNVGQPIATQRMQPVAPDQYGKALSNQSFTYLIPYSSGTGMQLFQSAPENGLLKPLRDFQTNQQFNKLQPTHNTNNMNLVLLNNYQIAPVQNNIQNAQNFSKVVPTSCPNYSLVPLIILDSTVQKSIQGKLPPLQPRPVFPDSKPVSVKTVQQPGKTFKSKENKRSRKQKFPTKPLSPKKSRFTTSGRKIPNYAEFNCEDNFEQDIDEDSLSSDSSSVSKSLAVKQESIENIPVLKKTENVRGGVSKGGKKKSKSRVSVYDSIALEDLHTISHSKTRYRVGFKKYGHIFSSALDRINRRMNRQSQFWRSLNSECPSTSAEKELAL